MTVRLYYQNSFLYNFTASVESARELADGRRALLLDATGFYPAGGGQPCDTGWVEFVSATSEEPLALPKLRVSEVIEDGPSGNILHVVEDLAAPLPLPLRVRGFIDVERRQDHMQQHSGQHVLSAAFRKLFGALTLSFHLGEESCAIDLDIANLDAAQLEQAERLANRFVWEDRQVLMHEVTREQAQRLCARKLPDEDISLDTLRLIEVRGLDICACCGTHVKTTGQIGNIQLRKLERVRQGMRVEFVCGARALRVARKDFQALTEAAGLCSGPLWELPALTAKLIDFGKAAQKLQQKLLAEVAGLRAQQALAVAPSEQGSKIVAEFFPDRDLDFIKLYAHKLVSAEANVIALLGAGKDAGKDAGQGTGALVFARSPQLRSPEATAQSSDRQFPGAAFDAGAELKAVVSSAGGRGGGTCELAQGAVPSADLIPGLIAAAAQRLRTLLGAVPGNAAPETLPR